jgi:hypothetical protein
MKHSFCGVTILGLFLGMAGQAMAQPAYSFTTLDVPGSSEEAIEKCRLLHAFGQYQDRR